MFLTYATTLRTLNLILRFSGKKRLFFRVLQRFAHVCAHATLFLDRHNGLFYKNYRNWPLQKNPTLCGRVYFRIR